MAEGGENIPVRTPENATSNFASRCKETAKRIGIGTAVGVGVALVANTILKTFGVELPLPILAGASVSASVVSAGLLNRK